MDSRQKEDFLYINKEENTNPSVYRGAGLHNLNLHKKRAFMFLKSVPFQDQAMAIIYLNGAFPQFSKALNIFDTAHLNFMGKKYIDIGIQLLNL